MCMCVCVHARARAHVRARVRACVAVCVVIRGCYIDRVVCLRCNRRKGELGNLTYCDGGSRKETMEKSDGN